MKILIVIRKTFSTLKYLFENIKSLSFFQNEKTVRLKGGKTEM